MKIPSHIKGSSKVIGYFSYTNNNHVSCDGDACIIAGSPEAMRDYLERQPLAVSEQDFIKKTRFGEIIEGLRLGGSYALDEESYRRFFINAMNNNMDCILPDEFFSDLGADMHFIRMQAVGG